MVWAVQPNRVLAVVLCAGLAAGCRHGSARGATEQARGEHGARGHGDAGASLRDAWTGMFWARFNDMPDGMHVQVWLDVQDGALRGAYRATPWSGEVYGTLRAQDGDVRAEVVLVERGYGTTAGVRTRRATLAWNASYDTLTGTDETGRVIEMRRARFRRAEMQPGMWLAFWTGLPPGVAVETFVSRDSNGRFHAEYSYRGTDGPHEGSFVGTQRDTGALELAWREVNDRAGVVRGAALLEPALFGLRGVYTVDGSTTAAGEWTLEPLRLSEP